MPFMWQLACILAVRDSSTGGLLEPPPGPSSDKQTAGEGPLGHQAQVLAHSPSPASSGSSGSLGQHLPHQLQMCSPGGEDRVGMAPALVSSSSSPAGAIAWAVRHHASMPQGTQADAPSPCQQGLSQTTGTACHTCPVSPAQGGGPGGKGALWPPMSTPAHLSTPGPYAWSQRPCMVEGEAPLPFLPTPSPTPVRVSFPLPPRVPPRNTQVGRKQCRTLMSGQCPPS